MMDATPESQLQQTVIGLLRHYSFEADRSLILVVAEWIRIYPAQWILRSIIEALYQGRYKVVSVEQILRIWQRRGQPLTHFSLEFERIVCDRVLGSDPLDGSLLLLSDALAESLSSTVPSRSEEGDQSKLASVSRDFQQHLSGDSFQGKELGEPLDVASTPKSPQTGPGSEAVAKPSTVTEPIHQFRPANAVGSVPRKLKAIAYTTIAPHSC